MAEKFTGPPAKYKQTYLNCKAWGHHWKHTTDFSIIRSSTGVIIQFTRQMVCAQCKGERHDVYDRQMRLAERRYIRPEAFETYGEHVIDVSIARSEFMRRLLVKTGDTPPVELVEAVEETG